VLYVFNTAYVLDMRIHDAVLVLEKRGEIPARDMAILINRRRQHPPAMLLIPLRIVGTTPEK